MQTRYLVWWRPWWCAGGRRGGEKGLFFARPTVSLGVLERWKAGIAALDTLRCGLSGSVRSSAARAVVVEIRVGEHGGVRVTRQRWGRRGLGGLVGGGGAAKLVLRVVVVERMNERTQCLEGSRDAWAVRTTWEKRDPCGYYILHGSGGRSFLPRAGRSRTMNSAEEWLW